jgi:hypothetical protein
MSTASQRERAQCWCTTRDDRAYFMVRLHVPALGQAARLACVSSYTVQDR